MYECDVCGKEGARVIPIRWGINVCLGCIPHQRAYKMNYETFEAITLSEYNNIYTGTTRPYPSRGVIRGFYNKGRTPWRTAINYINGWQ